MAHMDLYISDPLVHPLVCAGQTGATHSPGEPSTSHTTGSRVWLLTAAGNRCSGSGTTHPTAPAEGKTPSNSIAVCMSKS